MALNAEFFVKMPLSQKLLILVFVIVLVTLGYWFGIDSPKMVELKKLKCEEIDLQAQKAVYEELEGRVKLLEAEILKQRKEIDEKRRKLPVDVKMEELIDQFSKLGDARGLTIVKIIPENAVTKKVIMEVPLKLAIEGDYKKMMEFWYEVVDQERIIKFSDINIAQSNSRSGEGNLSFNFVATTYQFKEPDSKSQDEGGSRGRRSSRGRRGGQ